MSGHPKEIFYRLSDPISEIIIIFSNYVFIRNILIFAFLRCYMQCIFLPVCP